MSRGGSPFLSCTYKRGLDLSGAERPMRSVLRGVSFLETYFQHPPIRGLVERSDEGDAEPSLLLPHAASKQSAFSKP